MDTNRTTTTATRHEFDFAVYAQFGADGSDGGDALARKRLRETLAENAEIERENAPFGSAHERAEIEAMARPVATEDAFAYFGALLGVFPPAAIFARLLFNEIIHKPDNFWMFGIVGIVCIISATVGYFSGKRVGRAVRRLEEASWSKMLLALPFLGALWGITSGGAGGFVIYIVGSLFGALLGGAVGAVALPMFAVVHRLLKRGEFIEEKYFLPLAFGVAAVITAFIVGL